jgi:hypothetical protein
VFVEVVGEVTGVLVGPGDVARAAGPEQAFAKHVHAGNIAYDAAVVPDTAFAVDNCVILHAIWRKKWRAN